MILSHRFNPFPCFLKTNERPFKGFTAPRPSIKKAVGIAIPTAFFVHLLKLDAQIDAFLLFCLIQLIALIFQVGFNVGHKLHNS